MQDSLPAGGLRLYREGVEPSGSLRKVSGYITVLLSRTSPVARVVYAKPPFGGPDQVLAYLGRYTHRVAISNARLVSVTDEHIAFRWKDYRHDGKAKVMTLEPFEFIRRFLLHALPDGFHRIRHYGFLANGHRAAKLAFCRSLLDMPSPSGEVEDIVPPRAPERCPCCGGVMIVLAILPRLTPHRPSFWDDTS
jgi:Putative transposase